MAHTEQKGASRWLATYGLLLELYPRPYLQRHRAEMLQNFQDLERASSSKSALWLFLARDLAVSLRSQFTRTLWGQTAMVVLVLAVVLVYAEHHAVARRHPTEACCFGYILGWFAGWFGKQWQASSISRTPSYIRSWPAQAMIVVSVLGLVIAVTGVGPRTQSHVIIWTLCYGFLLAWGSGWLGNRRQARS
ncbi:MAG TPA: hypothetical protein VF221_14145 [Chloroflexota bacterium]